MSPWPRPTIVARFRNPEYTGENRCLPCTATNLVIAVVVSALLGYVTLEVDAGRGVAWGVTGGSFLVSVAAISLRGYLVPGTPALTKRYFPALVLDLFGKGEAEGVAAEPVDASVDVEAVLLDTHAIEPRPHGDLGLTDEFETALFEQIETERANDTGREALGAIVGVDAETLEFESFGDGAFVAVSGSGQVGRWESRAAFLADAAAGRLLPDRYDGWEDADPAARGAILGGLRLFLERCPACDGSVRFGQEVVESCCRTHDVVAVTCEDCDARLFEVEVTEGMLADEPEPAV
ncbi:hypothetical protein ACFR9U_17725 [Halorientalis brevis]|uniref:Uncharacterized protein n=1 Tax=Halorientalis brevis TaxID=1126241 RepID=A0ABD6CEL9_9EURY|nr:hypothetical protein [Halorientalis brevis]